MKKQKLNLDQFLKTYEPLAPEPPQDQYAQIIDKLENNKKSFAPLAWLQWLIPALSMAVFLFLFANQFFYSAPSTNFAAQDYVEESWKDFADDDQLETAEFEDNWMELAEIVAKNH